MRQTLFRIPLSEPWSLGPLGDVPGFGWGVVLLVWMLFGAWWLVSYVRRTGGKLNADLAVSVGIWLAVAAVITQVPRIAARVAPDGIPVFGYGFMLFVGFITAAWFASWRARQEGLQPEVIWDLAMWGFIPGIVGARVFYLVQYHERVFAGKKGLELLVAAINLPDGGIVFYGGLLTGIAAYFIFCHVRQLRPLALADIVVPSVFIGVGFGRIGCLLNGCCFGDRCTLPWGIQFPQGSVPYSAFVNRGFLSPEAAASFPLHPTQIYSSIDGFLIALVTAVYFKYRQRDGEVLAVAWLIYPVTRFLIEFLRGDELGQFNTSLTISQWVSVVLFATGLMFLGYLSQQPRFGEVPSEPVSLAGRRPVTTA